MMSDACRDYRAALGAAALGGLEPAEQLALQAHLDGCPACRAELRDLSSVAAALPLADPNRLALRPEPARDLGARVLDRVAYERDRKQKRRRQRVLVAIAAVLAVVLALGAYLSLHNDNGAGEGTRVVFPASAGVSGTATLRARAAGTEVSMHVSGLPAGEYYWLWLSDEKGERVGAGTFRGVADELDVITTAALPLRKTHRIWVTDEDRKVVLDQVLTRS
jgi:predicted anti-sigma-YlaC factor YlaD